jgi:hypothetical protein
MIYRTLAINNTDKVIQIYYQLILKVIKTLYMCRLENSVKFGLK